MDRRKNNFPNCGLEGCPFDDFDQRIQFSGGTWLSRLPISPSASFSTALFAALLAVVGAWQAPLLSGADVVSFKRDGVTRTVRGEALVTSQDGGMLLRAPSGVLWIIEGGEVVSREDDNKPFVLNTAHVAARELEEELGNGFSIHTTAHYVIAYNTSPAYARWCGGLYERLFRAFRTYWKSKGVELREPDGPLIAIVFDSSNAYKAYAQRDLGVEIGGMPGYYNVRTNRVTMYDLTGVNASNLTQIRQMLRGPQAERTVATIVHEATHQLAYNMGLQTRYADNPFWVSEGLAVYFETPDLRSSRGWRGIGEVNQLNHALFRKYLSRRPANSLELLLTKDDRFRGENQGDAYSEAWALNFFLLKRYPQQYGKYLEKLAARTPLVELSPAERLKDFSEAFGPLETINGEFLRFMEDVR